MAEPSSAVRPPTIAEMRFRVVRVAHTSRSRAGIWGSQPTPCVLLPTLHGQPLHITRDLQATLPDEVLTAAVRFPQMMGHFAREAKKHADGAATVAVPLSSFCGLGDRTAVLLLRSPAEQTTSLATDSSVSFNTAGGRRAASLAAYTDALLALRPHAAVSFHDEIAHGAGNNRSRSSLSRSLEWLRGCLTVLEASRKDGPSSAPTLALESSEPPRKAARTDTNHSSHGCASSGVPAESSASIPPSSSSSSSSLQSGSDGRAAPPVPGLLAYVPVLLNAVAQKKSINDVLEVVSAADARASAARPSPVVGFSLGGLFFGEAPEERAAALLAATAALPSEGVRLLSGARTPLEIIDAVLAGVDVIDTEYAAILSEFGCAAAFALNEEEAVNMTRAAVASEASFSSSGIATTCAATADDGAETTTADAAPGGSSTVVSDESASGSAATDEDNCETALKGAAATPLPLQGTTAARRAAAGSFRTGQNGPTGGTQTSSTANVSAAAISTMKFSASVPLGGVGSPPGWLQAEASSTRAINLRDPMFAADTRPLVAGCPCFTCNGLMVQGNGPAASAAAAATAASSKSLTTSETVLTLAPPSGRPAGNVFPARPVSHPGHSRAYIYHLLNTQEMLGSSLLMLHNVTRIALLAKELRSSILASPAATSDSTPAASYTTSASSSIGPFPSFNSECSTGAAAAASSGERSVDGAAGYRAWFVATNYSASA